jgi:hypothetical protein
MAISKKLLTEKQTKLDHITLQLKEHFIGIDPIIDELIHHIRIWYLMPELLHRPVIINLWGMTGVGKTDLIRQLVKLLGFEDRFAEVELSNSSNSTYFRYANSVGDILRRYSIKSEAPNILFFDEIQKFRTIDEEKKDVANLQFQDFWELLSDGKLSKRDQADEWQEILLNTWRDVERQEAEKKRESENPSGASSALPLSPSYLSGWELRKLQSLLGIDRNVESLTKVRQISAKDLAETLQQKFTSKQIFESDNYAQSLIIISGNLDEAYSMSGQTQEAEVDPDIFYAQTSKISLIEIKQALTKRFKPEQVSRFGNIHLIYPSLRKNDFEKLITQKLEEIVGRVETEFGIQLELDTSLNDLIYQNGVFPVQGVRPVFSAINDIVESQLAQLLFVCLTEGFTSLDLKYDAATQTLVAGLGGKQKKPKTITLSFVGRIDKVRQSNSEDVIAVTSVHEAGHAVMYAVAFGIAPLQLKSNLASSSETGFTFSHLLELTKQNTLQKIQVLLAGYCAEELVFGSEHVTAGSSSDLEFATNQAADYIRRYGFSDELKVRIVSEYDTKSSSLSTDLAQTNTFIQVCVNEQLAACKKVLSAHREFLFDVAIQLKEKTLLHPQEFIEIAQKHNVKCRAEAEHYRIVEKYAEKLIKVKNKA